VAPAESHVAVRGSPTPHLQRPQVSDALGKRGQGDLRSDTWQGQETLPQRVRRPCHSAC